MKLDDLEKELLKAIYDKDFENKKIDWTGFPFESNNHKAFVLQKLERFGFIEFDGHVFDTGGQRDTKYGVAVVLVHQEGIHITEKGISTLEE